MTCPFAWVAISARRGGVGPGSKNADTTATHVGSLPRPADLDEVIFRREDGEQFDPTGFAERTRQAVTEAVARQLEAGVDVVGDGEMGKVGHSTYVKDRLAGFGGHSRSLQRREMIEFPEVFEQLERSRVASWPVPLWMAVPRCCWRPAGCCR
jgi:methionine synthase II (cobalamin-independent)